MNYLVGIEFILYVFNMKKLFLLFALIFISNCATPYQPNGLLGGFEDISLGDNKHKITFKGNGYTSKNTLKYYTERRASEICRGQAFEILDQDYDVVGSLGPIAGMPILVSIISCSK